jgi:hypothetical protein
MLNHGLVLGRGVGPMEGGCIGPISTAKSFPNFLHPQDLDIGLKLFCF